KKVKIIKRKEENKNLTYTDLAKEYDIDRSTISNILRDKNNHLQLYNTTSAYIQQHVHLQNRQFHIIDKAVYKLFLELHSHNVPVSGFQQRFGISSKTISGESESANKAAIESRRCHFQELLNNYYLDNILNANKTGLYFHLGPNKTLASKNDTAKEYKKDKSCLTILLCCNASGTQKFKPFVISKSACPNQVNQSTILLTDNCSAYSSPKLQNIKLKFLPPNITSVIQLCDASIIKNFKVNYHKLLVTKWINEVEILSSTIVHCWKKTKILLLEINLTTDTNNNNNFDELEQLLEELEMSYDYIKLSAEEYVEQGLINNKDSNNEADDEEEKEIIDDLVSYNEGKKALEVAKKYLEQSQFATKNDIYLL
ncbi:19465_t:CDS:2, partial [Cetraspora pellucida]